MQIKAPLLECEFKWPDLLLWRCAAPLSHAEVEAAVFSKINLRSFIPPPGADSAAALYVSQHLLGSRCRRSLQPALIYRLEAVIVGKAHLAELNLGQLKFEGQFGQLLV